MSSVFVSGCFDCLHAGHVYFLEQAATLGDLYVSVGADETIRILKNKLPVYTEQERLYLIQSLKFVKEAFIGEGRENLDFKSHLARIKPDFFFVNEDGDSPQKRAYVESLGIKYIIEKRLPKEHMPVQSTTAIRKVVNK